MACILAPEVSQSFATDGTANGTFTVADVTNLRITAIVNIYTSGSDAIRCKIWNIDTTSKTVTVRTDAVTPAVPNLTAYTVVGSAKIYQPLQAVYKNSTWNQHGV